MLHRATIQTAVLVLGLVALATPKPIMVTFGTKQGPIVLPSPKPPAPQARSFIPENPAPVSEEAEDIPNPSTYRPMVPHQYRTKIYAQKPTPNLVLGTPLDQKYTPAIDKYDVYKKQRMLGETYTGPNVFERQDYELLDVKKKTTLQPSVSYVKPQYYQRRNDQVQYVPQIGIIYSAGVRYYVPQMVYYKQEEDENSIYDNNDEKYFHRYNKQ